MANSLALKGGQGWTQISLLHLSTKPGPVSWAESFRFLLIHVSHYLSIFHLPCLQAIQMSLLSHQHSLALPAALPLIALGRVCSWEHGWWSTYS